MRVNSGSGICRQCPKKIARMPYGTLGASQRLNVLEDFFMPKYGMHGPSRGL